MYIDNVSIPFLEDRQLYGCQKRSTSGRAFKTDSQHSEVCWCLHQANCYLLPRRTRKLCVVTVTEVKWSSTRNLTQIWAICLMCTFRAGSLFRALGKGCWEPSFWRHARIEGDHAWRSHHHDSEPKRELTFVLGSSMPGNGACCLPAVCYQQNKTLC